MNRTRFLVAGFVAGMILLGYGIDAGAQDRLKVAVQPSMVTVTEGSVGEDVNGFANKTSPVLLSVSAVVQDGLVVRGHVTVPTSINSVSYNAYDSGKRIMSTDYPNVDLYYRDWALGMQWRPVKDLDWVYALVNYEATSYKRTVSEAIGIIVNGQEVRQTASVQFGHQTLSFGVGLERKFSRFGFRAEASVAPFLSNTTYDSGFDNTTGYTQRSHSNNGGGGSSYTLGGKYDITNNVGLGATWSTSSFRYQNEFDKLNDLHPQTRWNRFALGVITCF